jgi:hypothetical protein
MIKRRMTGTKLMADNDKRAEGRDETNSLGSVGTLRRWEDYFDRLAVILIQSDIDGLLLVCRPCLL